MSTKGELFNSDMVQAFLEGRKSRTSRPIKPYLWDTSKVGFKAMQNCRAEFESKISGLLCYRKPKYRKGDIMYVRETWSTQYDGIHDGNRYGTYVYKANGTILDNAEGMGFSKWRPSIHMPREAARLWFRVTDVKVQNIADMTEQDAIDDGFVSNAVFTEDKSDYRGFMAVDHFYGFWTEQYGTDTNWMWVYTLEKISKEDGQNAEK